MYVNRRARFEYELLDTLEAGIALTGSEARSVREGGIDFRDAYARVERHNVELEGLYIPPYKDASYNNHEPRRKRRLLLHRQEILKLERALSQKGLTLVPVRLYQKGRRYKVELALARGKQLHDKRRSEREREARREMREA